MFETKITKLSPAIEASFPYEIRAIREFYFAKKTYDPNTRDSVEKQ